MLLHIIVTGPLAENCYVVGDNATLDAMIIDPGDNAENILDVVSKFKLKVGIIVLTHAHWDHFGALKEVKDATKAAFALHENDVPLLDMSPAHMFGLSYPKPPKPDCLLHHSDKVKVGNMEFTVLHTPGHTPGGICLYGGGVLFSGDTLFNRGIGRTDIGGSFEDIMNSIKTHLLTLPEDTIVCPGHGPDTTIGEEKRENPFL